MNVHPTLNETDPAIADLVEHERARQFYTAKLIPSENYASSAVLAATGTVLTNKYSEGYPRKRYYEGQQYIDQVEELAIARARSLFGAEHANVQPYSGSPANLAAYSAMIKKKATNKRILGLRLPEGGHLTHGWSVSVTSRFFEADHYAVDPDTGLLDYEAIRAKALAYEPTVIVCGATCYPRVIDFARFRAIADDVGALLMVDMAHIAGLIAGGAHPSPAPYADLITSTTHKTLRGPRGAIILARQSLARKVNSAVFPNMQGGPMVHAIAAKAVAFAEAATPEFRAYAAAIVANAQALAGALAGGGLRIVSGGTDNHLMLVDVSPRDITGQEAEDMLRGAGIIANKNAIPFDPLPPRVTSGVRLGTPALTSRGMNAGDMDIIAGFILEALDSSGDKGALASIRSRVKSFASGFLVPGVE